MARGPDGRSGRSRQPGERLASRAWTGWWTEQRTCRLAFNPLLKLVAPMESTQGSQAALVKGEPLGELGLENGVHFFLHVCWEQRWKPAELCWAVRGSGRSETGSDAGGPQVLRGFGQLQQWAWGDRVSGAFGDSCGPGELIPWQIGTVYCVGLLACFVGYQKAECSIPGSPQFS